MTLIESLILGIVEGLTEFLPVSSTGHLIIASNLLGLEESGDQGQKVKVFEIFIQSGAILAMLGFYFKDFLGLIPGTNIKDSERSYSLKGMDGLLKLGIACAPMIILALLFHKKIKEHLFSVQSVAYALIVGGILLIFAELQHRKRATKNVENHSKTETEVVTFKNAFLIGLFQCLALWPGMSRSGATISGGLILGVSRRSSTIFSFFTAVPMILSSVGYDLLKNYQLLNVEDLPNFAMGFLSSLVIAAVSIKFFLKFVSHFSMVPFGVYRIVVGGLLFLIIQ